MRIMAMHHKYILHSIINKFQGWKLKVQGWKFVKSVHVWVQICYGFWKKHRKSLF